RLYAKRVLITDDINILPGWLRFVRLIVDAPGIDLNVSREMIQQTPAFAAIRRAIVNRLMSELSKLTQNDAEKFSRIWKNFGAVLKEGLYEEPEKRDQIYEICRFVTTLDSEGQRTLKDYTAALKTNQTAIYYIAGDDISRLRASPQLEGFRQRGIEVLLLSDPVDAFWVSNALGYDGKPFKSVTQGAADIANIPLESGAEDKPSQAQTPSAAALIAFLKETLGDAIADVRSSDRLAESPACLVASEHALDRRLEQILAEHGRAGGVAKPVLEINLKHKIIASLAANIQSGADKSSSEDASWLVFDEARMMDGEKPLDPAAFRARLFRMLEKSVAPPENE
ncbi:MAG: molecular chaperone HtpG, partial [Alphaproteobacteria bacterium]|nr:molecular chaperone HtpG [Alphaproteobacteria bacterium]